MRVLAIDPGFGRCGVAVVERGQDGKDVLLYSDCIETSAKEVFLERLAEVGTEVERLLTLYKPDAFAIEEVFFSTNQKTALHTAEVRGMLLYVAYIKGIPIYEYNPGRVKIALTGYGNASKDQVTAMVHKLTNITKSPMLDDEYDAIAIGLTHLAENRERFAHIQGT